MLITKSMCVRGWNGASANDRPGFTYSSWLQAQEPGITPVPMMSFPHDLQLPSLLRAAPPMQFLCVPLPKQSPQPAAVEY